MRFFILPLLRPVVPQQTIERCTYDKMEIDKL